ncbi:MAG TPA: FHA domain-containing protein [Polyangiaceae bacterium]
MWKLTIQDDQGNKTAVHLVRDEYTVGRDELNAVRLTERNISRRHARFARVNSEWRIQDLTSYNGCYVNGARVVDTQSLMHGDLIQVGDYRLTVEDESLAQSREDGVLTIPGRPGMNTQSDRLVLMAGPGQGQEFVLGAQRVVLGRGEECEVSINHPSVSRVHAEIRKIGEGHYELVDLGSANGVRVNGVELPSAMLDARDVIELGDVLIKFVSAGEIYIPGGDELARRDLVDVPRSAGISLPVKIALGASIAAVVAVLAVALRGTEAPPEPLVARASGGDRLAEVLRDAKRLLEGGDPEAARERANSIPEGSNLRQSADFKAIQDAWADALFAKAGGAQDPSEKRALLDRVASSPSVDPGRRKRAAEELESMQKATVNIADLPSDDQLKPAPLADSAAPAVAPPKPTPPPVEAATAAAPPPTQKKPAAAPKPAPSPPAQGGGTLVRKNPFGNP